MIQIDKEKLKLYKYELDLTDKEIGSLFGCAASTISKYRRKYGIKSKREIVNKNKPSKKELIKYINEGLTDQEIANKYNKNITKHVIRSMRRKFNIKKKEHIYNLDIFKRIIKENFGDKFTLLDEEYNGMWHKYNLHCNDCGENILKWGADLQQGSGCPVCSKNKKFTIEDLRKYMDQREDGCEYRIIKRYHKEGTGTRVLVEHLICNEITEMSTDDIVHRNRVCPCITRSKNEVIAKKILDKNELRYETEVTFEDCKNINRLKFDFKIYLDGKRFILLEMDGEEHDHPIDFFGGIKKFKKRKKNDEIKNTYCKLNNIPLIRIPCWKVDDIEKEVRNKVINKYFKNSQYSNYKQLALF